MFIFLNIFLLLVRSSYNKDANDKYFLLTTSSQNFLFSSWADTTDHFLFQLKSLRIQ